MENYRYKLAISDEQEKVSLDGLLEKYSQKRLDSQELQQEDELTRDLLLKLTSRKGFTCQNMNLFQTFKWISSQYPHLFKLTRISQDKQQVVYFFLEDQGYIYNAQEFLEFVLEKYNLDFIQEMSDFLRETRE